MRNQHDFHWLILDIKWINRMLLRSKAEENSAEYLSLWPKSMFNMCNRRCCHLGFIAFCWMQYTQVPVDWKHILKNENRFLFCAMLLKKADKRTIFSVGCSLFLNLLKKYLRELLGGQAYCFCGAAFLFLSYN